jgi:hypothetical protein
MFYLIVKDPRRIPPERAALDQGIRSLAACPRTCCAAFSWSLGRLQRFKRIYRKYRNFGRLSMDFFHLFSAPCSTKFERSVPKTWRLRAWGFGGQFCPREEFPLAVQWIVRSGRSFLRYRFPARSSPAKIQPDFLKQADSACLS